VGYLPFTLYYKQHKHFLHSTVLAGKNGAWTDKYKVYELFSDNVHVQQFILFLWWLLIAAFLVWLIRKGTRNTGLLPDHLIHHSTEEAQMYIDREAAAHDGKVNGVDAPRPVPPEAWVKD
jgi:hypothetical protein